MSKRKIRFNIIDLIIILIIVAAAFVLVKVFTGGNNDIVTETNYKKIQYVIEIQNVEDRFDGSVKKGDAVQDAIERKSIGTVVGVQSSQFERITFDYDSGMETVSVVEGRIVLNITIEATAVVTDRAFTVDGCEIRVGEQYSVILPEFYGIGYCIKVTETDQK
ncbi:MAG: DUF4330 family protein [Ruminococcaceae bacterium]|nr:DUF4330 family protein [Oscillospiraceae bacterium]